VATVATVAQRAAALNNGGFEAALKTGCLIWGDHSSSTSQRFSHMLFLAMGRSLYYWRGNLDTVF